jgi:hypothetical protein
MIRWVRSYDEDYLTRTEAAESLDITLSQLTWIHRNHPDAGLGPSHKARYQGIEVLLYSPERIEGIRDWLVEYKASQTQRRGRIRLFSSAELQARRRLGGRIRDYRMRAPQYEEQGRIEDAKALYVAAEMLEKQLADERAAREAELRAAAGPSPNG